jgi:hypothetical protein
VVSPSADGDLAAQRRALQSGALPRELAHALLTRVRGPASIGCS